MTILVIGGGKMGMSHLALLTHYLGKSNVALCDTSFWIQHLYRMLGYKTFSDVDVAASVLDSLQGVLIATPTKSHASLLRWAIRKRLPCFVEKPLTLDYAASSQLQALAASEKVPVQVGFVLRYLTAFQRLRYLVLSGRLGSVLDYNASMRGNVISRTPNERAWQGRYALGGGCLNEYGPHVIDLCRFIFGSVSQVASAETASIFCAHADDRAEFVLEHISGGKGEIIIDWCDLTKRKSVVEFNVRFKTADVRVDNSSIEIRWSASCSFSKAERLELESLPLPANVDFYLRGEEFSLELEDFLETCTGRQFGARQVLSSDTTPRLEDGYAVDRLIHQIAEKAGLR